jgi:hypothetical protein
MMVGKMRDAMGVLQKELVGSEAAPFSVPDNQPPSWSEHRCPTGPKRLLPQVPWEPPWFRDSSEGSLHR